jgi:hypothetical protein
MNPAFNRVRGRTSVITTRRPNSVSPARLLATFLVILSGAVALAMVLGLLVGLEVRDLQRLLPGWPW